MIRVVDVSSGSYGACPIEVRDVYRHYQDRYDAQPDAFVRYEYRDGILDECRAVVASYLNAPKEACVFVPNTSTGIDTILRNLVYEPGDVIICFATVYLSFEYTMKYLTETTPVHIQKVEYTLPQSDDSVCARFEVCDHCDMAVL
jgi:hercynylcysteine S-oxide lyase